jgi:hypothetical protein
MRALRETALVHIADVFAEGGDAFLLEPAVFCGEVAVGLRVAWRAFVVVAEDIVGEEELRVAAGAGCRAT